MSHIRANQKKLRELENRYLDYAATVPYGASQGVQFLHKMIMLEIKKEINQLLAVQP